MEYENVKDKRISTKECQYKNAALKVFTSEKYSLKNLNREVAKYFKLNVK